MRKASFRSPAVFAKYLEHRLEVEKHLPFVSVEPVKRDLMPAQYYDGSTIY